MDSGWVLKPAVFVREIFRFLIKWALPTLDGLKNERILAILIIDLDYHSHDHVEYPFSGVTDISSILKNRFSSQQLIMKYNQNNVN